MQLNKELVIKNPLNYTIVNYLGNKKFPKDLEFISHSLQIGSYKLHLGTHPDIIELLWNEFTKRLPINCKAILYGTPVLINPENGLVFSLAEGTNPPLLRLSEYDKNNLLVNGGKIKLLDMDGVYADASILGNEWVFCFSFINNFDDYCLKAFEYTKGYI